MNRNLPTRATASSDAAGAAGSGVEADKSGSSKRERSGGRARRCLGRSVRWIPEIELPGTSERRLRVPLLLIYRFSREGGGGFWRNVTDCRSFFLRECISTSPYYGATNDRWGVAMKSGKISEILASTLIDPTSRNTRRRVPLLLGFPVQLQVGGVFSERFRNSRNKQTPPWPNPTSNECISMSPYYGATGVRWGVSEKSGKISKIVASSFPLPTDATALRQCRPNVPVGQPFQSAARWPRTRSRGALGVSAKPKLAKCGVAWDFNQLSFATRLTA